MSTIDDLTNLSISHPATERGEREEREREREREERESTPCAVSIEATGGQSGGDREPIFAAGEINSLAAHQKKKLFFGGGEGGRLERRVRQMELSGENIPTRFFLLLLALVKASSISRCKKERGEERGKIDRQMLWEKKLIQGAASKQKRFLVPVYRHDVNC